MTAIRSVARLVHLAAEVEAMTADRAGAVAEEIRVEALRLRDTVDELRRLRSQVAELTCPRAAGFEGLETYPDCGECVVCRCRRPS